MKLVIQEYSKREVIAVTEFPERETFLEVTGDLILDLRNTATTAYMTSVLTKWFGGQQFADPSPGDVREYDGSPGDWTDYLIRI